MPLPALNLDDRTFDQLESEARGLIPRQFPAWTDHNLSDPGVTLMELFAFLAEAAIYQINRVPERSLERFAGLVGVARVVGEPIEATLRRALEALETRHRAVTEDEWESLAKESFMITEQSLTNLKSEGVPDNVLAKLESIKNREVIGEVNFQRLLNDTIGEGQTVKFKSVILKHAAHTTIARAKAVVEVKDTPNVFPDEQTVKIIIVPNQPGDPTPSPSGAQRQRVFTFLRDRRLITARVQVVGPAYTTVRIAVTVARDPGSRLDAAVVQQKVSQAIRDFLSPVSGGVDGQGWEFGRPVFRSELYQIIEGIPGVDHVRQLLLAGTPNFGEKDESAGEIQLSSPTSLVSLDEAAFKVTVLDK